MVLALCLLVSVCMPVGAAKVDEMTDVSSGQWYYRAVNYCLENGLMNGQGGGKFNPGGTVNRAMVAQTLYNKAGKPSTTGLANPFSDVGGEWFRDAIVWCKANNVVNGTSNTAFTPGGLITREQACVMVYNFFKGYLAQTPELASASDMAKYADWPSVSSWAQDAVRWAVKSGFMKGKTDTTLVPNGQASRAELAQFLMNFDYILNPELPTVCEHGNNPDTCEICHPKTPSTQGIYNPNPPAENFISNAIMGAVNDTLNRTPVYKENNYNNNVNYDLGRDSGAEMFSGTMVYDATVSNKPPVVSIPVHSRRNWVPIDGHVTNGSTYEVPVAGYAPVVKATEGSTIWNKYGNDVSDVDGELSAYETEIANFTIRHIVKNADFSSETNYKNVVWADQYAQMTAEAMMVDALENIDNLVKAGWTMDDMGLWSQSNTRVDSFALAVVNGSPEVSRKLLEISKTASSKGEAMIELSKEVISPTSCGGSESVYNHTFGCCGDTYTISGTGELVVTSRWGDDATKQFEGTMINAIQQQYIRDTESQYYFNTVGYKNYGSAAVIRFASRPTAQECAFALVKTRLNYAFDSNDTRCPKIFGFAFDESTNTLLVYNQTYSLNMANQVTTFYDNPANIAYYNVD